MDKISSIISKINEEGTYFANSYIFPKDKEKFVTFIPTGYEHKATSDGSFPMKIVCDVYVCTLVRKGDALTVESAQETYITGKLLPIFRQVYGFTVENHQTFTDISRGTPAVFHSFTLKM